MAAFRKQGGTHTHTLIRILFCLISKASSGGATIEDLKNIYCEISGKDPCDKTIQRAVSSLNDAIMDSLPQEISRGADKPICYRKGQKGQKGTYQLTRRINSGCGLKRDKKTGATLALFAQSKLLGEQEVDNLLLGLAELMEVDASTNIMPEEIRHYIHVSGSSPQEWQQHLRYILAILRACRNTLGIKFRYSVDKEMSEDYRFTVNPYGLLVRRGDWYVVGENAEKNERRLYRIDHMRDLTVQESGIFIRPDGFSMDREYRDAWGVWTKDEKQAKERVVLELDAEVVRRFRHITYHHSQELLEEEKGGKVIFHVTGAVEMVPWLMGWGDKVRVLEPEWLRNKVMDEAERLINVYKKNEE